MARFWDELARTPFYGVVRTSAFSAKILFDLARTLLFVARFSRKLEMRMCPSILSSELDWLMLSSTARIPISIERFSSLARIVISWKPFVPPSQQVLWELTFSRLVSPFSPRLSVFTRTGTFAKTLDLMSFVCLLSLVRVLFTRQQADDPLSPVSRQFVH